MKNRTLFRGVVSKNTGVIIFAQEKQNILPCMRASAGDERNFALVGSTKERYPVLIVKIGSLILYGQRTEF